LPLLRERHILSKTEHPNRIGLRVVAPTGFFLSDHLFNDRVVMHLRALHERVPLHIDAVLHEQEALRAVFGDTPIVGVSDSSFHSTKPDFAWNYGLPLADSDRFEIKRFGYHGISAASVVRTLRDHGKLPPKVVICHLGSGASVTAVWHGKSRDTTMGYSPLEGLVMATRSGSIDPAAVSVLKCALHFDDAQMEAYLNEQSGLLGLSGASDDIRELLKREAEGDHFAHLALETYLFSVQKAIGQMTATLGGIDLLVFTGTVGERSASIRARILSPFHYIDLALDHHNNAECTAPAELTCISRLAHSRPVFVVPADEAAEIARRTLRMAV
jgi:acetate kinase